MKIPTREEDEKVLDALRLRAKGVPASEVARRLAFSSPEWVRVSCQRVLRADLAESGEDPALVAAAYAPACSVSGDVQ